MQSRILIENEYLPFLKSCIHGARNKIYCMIYYAHIRSAGKNCDVKLILSDLVQKKISGVDVKVLLNYTDKKNYLYHGLHDCFAYLFESGVCVKRTDQKRVTHSKVCLFDNEHIICGSHNWSRSSLEYNREVSLYLSDVEQYKKLETYFLKEFYEAKETW